MLIRAKVGNPPSSRAGPSSTSHLGPLPGWAPLSLLPGGLLLPGAAALPVVAGPRVLTSVIVVIESGLMTIITGLPLLSFARTRKDSGMIWMSVYPACARLF